MMLSMGGNLEYHVVHEVMVLRMGENLKPHFDS
jgi:hypothetical protein